ncbi:MAG TPA: class I SAM-dependent methyltransferase [Azospirillum sp.]|nr:class I SAM-dependent methyltransferase [Azospirillum sp.]
MTTLRRADHKAILAEVLDVRGLTVADVGCGDGGMARRLTQSGATVIGIEPSAGQLARARAAEPVGNETYLEGRGESLPFEDGSLDAVLYFNSLHHLPMDAMTPALKEAARVLRPGGALVVVEPLAEGAYFEAVRAMDDETAERAAAYAALRDPPAELKPERELFYANTLRFQDFGQLLDRVLAVDEARRARLPAVEAEMRRRFAEGGRNEDGKTAFDQPMRLNLLRRAA